MDKDRPRIRRKSSAIKVSLSRSNTHTSSSPSDEAEHASLNASTTAEAGTVPNLPATGLGAAVEAWQSTVGKRITTWAYLRAAHEGKTFWFNTVLLGQDELLSAFENSRMRIRTTRFAVLGMSLSALFDITAPHDFLRGLLSLLTEFDAVPDDKFDIDRKNPRGVFRTRPKKAGSDFAMGISETGETSYLFTPNIPFELDYFQVLYTFCDMLVDLYTRISSHLGSSALSTSSQFPQPPGANGATPNYTLVENVAKIDARLTKLLSQVTKDVDLVARKSIRNELNSLSAGLDFTFDTGGDTL